MRRVLIWLNLYGHEPKNTKIALFACFWTYFGQPHNHIGWTTSKPFASINPTNPRTNPWKFHEKILRIGGAGKWVFFWGGHFEFLSRPFWIFFLLHFIEKCSPFLWGIIFFCTMDGFSRILEKKLSELLCTRLYPTFAKLVRPYAPLWCSYAVTNKACSQSKKKTFLLHKSFKIGFHLSIAVKKIQAHFTLVKRERN